jgi:hypothetical protein
MLRFMPDNGEPYIRLDVQMHDNRWVPLKKGC